MTSTREPTTLERAHGLLLPLVSEAGLLHQDVLVLATPLTPEEAIGTPGRRDYPILVGKERVLEATVAGTRGQAFTDSAREFEGTLADVLALPLDCNQHRAIFTATLNAALAHLGRVTGTVHCKDDEPEQCALEIARHARTRGAPRTVGLIGLNPAIAERLVDAFGPENVRFTDLDRQRVGTEKFGVEIWDGFERTDDLLDFADLVLFTGTTLVNDTYDDLRRGIEARGKDGLVYGMTAAGASALLGFDRICPCGRPG